VKIFFASVADEIRHAVRRAAEQGRTIDKIELTYGEWDELKHSVEQYQLYPWRALHLGEPVQYMGVTVVREKL
jgi:hypothetical protein